MSTSLLETLNERMLQLKHQRRANKHLMDRIAQVEHKITEDHKDDPDAAERILWPSQYLMKDYSELNVKHEDIISQSILKMDVTSPDIADLHKRFDAILHPEPIEKNGDEETNSDDLELPEHLQKLVDQALAQME